MNLYQEVLFPFLCDWTMSSQALGKYRERTLREARGHVLELGFGTGHNLPHYPVQVSRLTAVDDHPKMYRLGRIRMDQASMRLHPCRVSAENLPWPENSFDTVVSTFTLCSITRIRQTVAEIFRVLKPGGAFLFLEHGLSENPRQQKWQHRLNPLQKKLGAGCNLNRDIFHFVLQEPFETLELKRFELEKVPGILGSCYQGMLKKSK